MDSSDLAAHVNDTNSFEFPWGKLLLPKIFGFQLTKFMVLELIAAAIMLAIFLPLARRIRSGAPVKGRFWNLMEAMLLFVRDEVARPAIGKHEASRYMPYLWTVFFFILVCNLLGLVPWAGSPTGALSVTLVLAGITFAVVVVTGVMKFGVFGFFKSLVPHMDLPKAIGIPLMPLLLVLELFGLIVKHGVLAIRLLANIFAGHLVVAVILSFILMVANQFILVKLGVTVASIGGVVALSFLDMLAAFLQAYIFTFLSALFIGMAVHPH